MSILGFRVLGLRVFRTRFEGLGLKVFRSRFQNLVKGFQSPSFKILEPNS